MRKLFSLSFFRTSRAFGGVLAFGFLAPIVQAQNSPVVLNTGGGQFLVSDSRSFSIDSTLASPAVEFEFGFGTDEVLQPSFFLDSFTVTLQDASGSPTAVYWTVDASGLVTAPATSGALELDPKGERSYPRPYPSIVPLLAYLQGFQVRAVVPPEFMGRSVTLFFDLFDNLDNNASQAWFTEPRVVGAPQLLIAKSGSNQCLLSWRSPSFGFVIQESTNVPGNSWSNSLAPVADDGTNKSAVVSSSSANLFFRLQQK